MTCWGSPVSETNGAMGTPVALLGRPGQARERLREALVLAGAQVVLEDEPSAVDVQMLRDAEPVAVLVALEPLIEDALEALEPAFNMPGVTVIFDEAELTVRREGWEAQRWVRHLAAKLHGHADVLPPGTESEPSLQPEPGLALASRQHSDLQLDQHLEAAAHAFETVPSDALCARASTHDAAPAASEKAGFDPERFQHLGLAGRSDRGGAPARRSTCVFSGCVFAVDRRIVAGGSGAQRQRHRRSVGDGRHRRARCDPPSAGRIAAGISARGAGAHDPGWRPVRQPGAADGACVCAAGRTG